MEKAIYLPALTGPQFDAVLAGLRLLQKAIDSGTLPSNVECILTNDSEHEGLRDLDEIDMLCERINSTEGQPQAIPVVNALRNMVGLAEEACEARRESDCDEDKEMLDIYWQQLAEARAALKAAGVQDA